MAWGFLLFLLFTTSFFHSTHHVIAYRLAPAPAPITDRPSPVMKGGYWPSGSSPLSSIHFSYFTHVFYAFVQPDPTTSELVITPQDAATLPNFTATLHCQRPPLKALLSIGGAASPSATFAGIVSTPSNRSKFIESSIAVARRYGLDGLDLDWEWPENPAQMADLGDLYVEWREAVEREAAECRRPALLLTSAVYFSPRFFLGGIPRSYPAAAMTRGLDWVNAMCYDYHGGWNTSETGAHAALYDARSNVSSSYGIESWVESGVPPNKLVMGLPLYGRTWRLTDPTNHGVRAPAIGVGPGSSDGTIVYSAVVEYNAANNATVVHDVATSSVYAYAGTDWIGYDDPVSVTTKIEFARGLGLGGYFFWALGFDHEWSISSTASMAWEN